MTVLVGAVFSGGISDFVTAVHTAVWPFTAAQSGRVTTIFARFQTSNPTGVFTLGIYDDVAGAPTNRLGFAKGDGNGIVVRAELNPPVNVVAGTKYWLGARNSVEQLDFFGNSGGSYQENTGTVDFPNPWGASGTSSVDLSIWGENTENQQGPALPINWMMAPWAFAVPFLGATPPGSIAIASATDDLAALIAGVGAVNASLTVTQGLAVSMAGVGAVAPSLKVSRPIAATVAGTSTVTPNLKVTRTLVTSIAGASTVTGNLKVTRALATAIAGTSSVVGNLKVTRGLATVIAGTGVVNGAIKVARALSTVIAGHGTVNGDLTTASGGATKNLAAAIAGSSTVQASLTRAAGLRTAIVGTSAVSFAVSVTRRLAAIVSGSSQISPNMTIQGAGPPVGVSMTSRFRRRMYQRWTRRIDV